MRPRLSDNRPAPSDPLPSPRRPSATASSPECQRPRTRAARCDPRFCPSLISASHPGSDNPAPDGTTMLAVAVGAVGESLPPHADTDIRSRTTRPRLSIGQFSLLNYRWMLQTASRNEESSVPACAASGSSSKVTRYVLTMQYLLRYIADSDAEASYVPA